MKCFSIHWSELHTLIVEAEDLSEAIATAKSASALRSSKLTTIESSRLRIDDNPYVDVEFDYNNCYQCDSNGISLDEKRS